MKYEQYSYEWLNGYGEAILKPSTVKGYNHYLHNYINPYMGAYDLEELTTYQIQMWVYLLQNKGSVKGHGRLNSKTVIQAYRIFSRSLKSACKMGLLKQNPCFGVELPRKKKPAYVWLEDATDIKDFAAAFNGTWLYMPVVIALSLGLRRSEVLGLQWGDFNFDKLTVTISRSIVRDRDCNLQVDDLKNDSSHRTILAPEFLITLLASIRPPAAEKDAYLFNHSNNNPINPESFSSAYCAFRKAHGLPKVRFHDLRHSLASYLFNSGVDPRIIQDILGHSVISTTLNTYVHTDYKKQQGAMTLVNGLFLGD